MNHILSKLLLISLIMILNVCVFAADLSLGSDTKPPGETAVIPVTISNDLDSVNMVCFTVNSGTTLPAPAAVKGTDQANILPEYCFVDDFGGGSYRITAFITTLPNIAAGSGDAIHLEFDLTGIPEAIYPLTVTSAEIYDVSNANVTGATSGGSITVDESSEVKDWMLIQ